MNEIGYSAIVLLVPLVGTTLGAAMCFVLKRDMPTWLRKVLLGFASGVMVAASIWSLLDPSIDQSAEMGAWAFVPAAVGLAIGFAFLLLIDTLTPHLHTNKVDAEGLPSKASRTSMMLAAVTIHNIPEGMTTGVVLAAALASLANGTGLHEAMIPALTLSIGMAIQNFPEGAIVSMPLRGTDPRSDGRQAHQRRDDWLCRRLHPDDDPRRRPRIEKRQKRGALNWTPLIGVQKKKVKRERPPVTLKQPEVFLWQKASSTPSWPRP